MVRWLASKILTKDTDERLVAVEKSMRRLEEEWTDVYHKFRTLQMRVAKQAQRLDQAPSPEDTQPEGEDGRSVPGAGTPAANLSPRARLIQQQILERRRANGGA
jgi:hypothetical protein